MADVRLHVEADSIPDLFLGAAEGMAEFLQPSGQEDDSGAAAESVPAGKETMCDVRIESVDRSALLVEFLAELLYLSSVHRSVFRQVRFSELGEFSLCARVTGRSVNGFADDIKAVTYRGAEILKDDSGHFQVTILFDI